MTDELIKQNAEEYASKLVERDYHEDMWLDLYDAHIAGANSRDEEVAKLKRLYEEVLRKYYETECKLRNPWISVENRLPEEDKDVFVRKICTNGIFHLVGKVLNGGKWYCYGFGWQDNQIITHWMPIPETPKEKEE